MYKIVREKINKSILVPIYYKNYKELINTVVKSSKKII